MDLMSIQRATVNSDFQDRVRVAMVVTAGEIVDSSSPREPSPRVSAAMIVTQVPNENGPFLRFLWTAATDPRVYSTVNSSGAVGATDSVILDVVREAWVRIYPGDTDGN